jgi:arginyl-tRNA synthetase
MTLKEHLASLLEQAVADILPGQSAVIELERPKSAEHGDFACNVAMRLAKPL